MKEEEKKAPQEAEEKEESASSAKDQEQVEQAPVDFEKQLADADDKYKRFAAEYYNYRERTAKEKAAMFHDGVRDTVEKLLPVLDNLERAVQSPKDPEDPLYKGVMMTLKSFQEILKGMGVEEIPAKGEKFNPNLHAAVSHIEDEQFGENEISLEMMKGYKYHDKVIRHSMVQVAN